MNPSLVILSITIFFVSCTTLDKDKSIAGKNTIPKNEKHRVAILPFNDVDSTLIKDLEKALQKKLPIEFFILGNTPLPPSAFYKPRQRYIADSLLVFLAKTNGNNFEKIIGVTTKDISTRKGEIENWGILGLGDCPGEACVISAFRAGRKKVLYKDFLRRMTTLALHELGHTYGLEHCPVTTCLMKDAEGKMNLDNGSSYCNKCLDYLSGKGMLSVGTPSEK